MLLFLVGLLILIAGYFTYGKLVERIVEPNDDHTPAISKADGVDFLVLPHWKNLLIQLLNIAGIGPVIGVILGIKFGAICFLIIPIGNIIGGAVHDYVAGMMSIRNGGASLTELSQRVIGKKFTRIYNIFISICLLLVVAVFINIPAGLVNKLMGGEFFWYAVGAIFIYYICASLFPVDKIIGKLYPIFGAALIIGSFSIFGSLMWSAVQDSSLLVESAAFKANMNTQPIIPVLFVTIACGIISGFHGTQSPIIARTMATERNGHQAFYGMMVLEGVIAMIWAAAGLAIYNLFPEEMLSGGVTVLGKITNHFLGSFAGSITVISIVVLGITSGDTALRSLRMSIAESVGLDQVPIKNRLIICIPLIAIISGLLAWSATGKDTFAQLWNYFAWSNQVIAAVTLMKGTIWLHRQGKNYWITFIPGIFMTFVILSYILWISPKHGGPVGFGLPLWVAYSVAAMLTAIFSIFTLKHKMSSEVK